MSKTYHFRLSLEDTERLEKIRKKVQPKYVDLKASDIMKIALRYYCEKEGLEGESD